MLPAHRPGKTGIFARGRVLPPCYSGARETEVLMIAKGSAMARGGELNGVRLRAEGRAAAGAGARRPARRRGIGYVGRLLAFGLAVLLGMAWVAPPVVFV